MSKKLIVWLTVIALVIVAPLGLAEQEEEFCDDCDKEECICEDEDSEVCEDCDKEECICHDDEEDEEDEEDEVEFEEVRELVEEFAEENVPALAERLEALLEEAEEDEEAEEEYKEGVIELGEWLNEYYELLEHRPAAARISLHIMRLEVEVDELLESIKDSDDKEAIGKRKKELAVTLSKIFDLQLRRHAMEIDILKDEIKEINSMIEKRKKNKEKIVNRHVKDLLSDDDDELSWW